MTIERAISIAADALVGQVDHFGKPTLLHCLRVMFAVPDELKVAAVLHDVLEDSPLDAQDLVSLGVEVMDVRLVCLLTHIKEQDKLTYFEYIKRVKLAPGSVTIKLADLADNMDCKRGVPKKSGLVKQYVKAMQILTGGNDESNKEG